MRPNDAEALISTNACFAPPIGVVKMFGSVRLLNGAAQAQQIVKEKLLKTHHRHTPPTGRLQGAHVQRFKCRFQAAQMSSIWIFVVLVGDGADQLLTYLDRHHWFFGFVLIG
jgi:hypothetical protein